MHKHGWKVGVLAAAVSLIGAVVQSEAAPPATSAPVAKTETSVDDGSGIEQTGYRRQRRIQRMIERETRENPGYSAGMSNGNQDYGNQDYGNQDYGTPGTQSEQFPGMNDSPDIEPGPSPSGAPTAPVGPVDSPYTRGGSPNQKAPVRNASATTENGATPPRKMPNVQPSHAEMSQPGMSGYPQGYCPTDNCQNYGYPTGYCPAGNCQNCYGCPCHSCCLGNCFKKLSLMNHGKIHPMNPGFVDDRDTTYYSAQGYGLPVVVPMAPNVRYQYNYGWGLPSSRITKVPYGFPTYHPQQLHSMAGSPQVHGEHPPMVYWPTDTTQMGVYGRRVPHWSPTPNVP